MGQTKWRPIEEEFLRTEFSSTQAREFLKDRGKGALHKVASLIATRYQGQFSQPFAEESPGELHLRRARIKTPKHRKKLKAFSSESVEDCERRLAGVSDRIYYWCKNHSDKRHRGPTVHFDLVATHRKTRIETAYSVFKAGHPLRPVMRPGESLGVWTTRVSNVFEKLPATTVESLESAARRINEEVLASATAEGDPDEFTRGQKASGLAKTMADTMEHWYQETGWMGICLIGGVNMAGKVEAHGKCTGADRDGADFETKLAAHLDVSEDHLRSFFVTYLESIFDRRGSAGHPPAQSSPAWSVGAIVPNDTPEVEPDVVVAEGCSAVPVKKRLNNARSTSTEEDSDDEDSDDEDSDDKDSDDEDSDDKDSDDEDSDDEDSDDESHSPTRYEEEVHKASTDDHDGTDTDDATTDDGHDGEGTPSENKQDALNSATQSAREQPAAAENYPGAISSMPTLTDRRHVAQADENLPPPAWPAQSAKSDGLRTVGRLVTSGGAIDMPNAAVSDEEAPALAAQSDRANTQRGRARGRGARRVARARGGKVMQPPPNAPIGRKRASSPTPILRVNREDKRARVIANAAEEMERRPQRVRQPSSRSRGEDPLEKRWSNPKTA